MVERLKYYLINDEITFDKIFSNGLLFHSLISFKERDYSPLANYYSSRFDDTDREVSEFSEALKENHEYFKIFDEKIEPEEYLKSKIKDVDTSDLDSLVYLISYLYIHKKNYKKYEDVAIAIIDEKMKAKQNNYASPPPVPSSSSASPEAHSGLRAASHNHRPLRRGAASGIPLRGSNHGAHQG